MQIVSAPAVYWEQEARAARRARRPRHSPRPLRAGLLAEFCRYCSSQLQALKLETAMEHLARRRHSPLAGPAGAILRGLQDGLGFTDAIRRAGPFPSPFIAAIAAGERGGALPRVLEHLGAWYAERQAFARQARRAFFYPGVIAGLLTAVGAFYVTHVFPALARAFEGHATLPPATRLILAGSQALARSWWLLPLAAVLAWRTLRAVSRIPGLRYRLPGFGALERDRLLSDLFTLLALLFQSGVPVREALGLIQQVSADAAIQRRLRAVEEVVRNGSSLAQAFRRDPFFPPEVGDYVDQGEQAGTTEQMLASLGALYTDAARERMQALVRLLEPLTLVLAGGLILVMFVTLVLPIYQGMSRLVPF